MQPGDGNNNRHMVSKPSIETITAQAMPYASIAPATTIRMSTHHQAGSRSDQFNDTYFLEGCSNNSYS